MVKTDYSNWWIIDTETDALKGYTKLHCTVVRNVKDKDNVHVFRHTSDLLDWLSFRPVLVGHNIVNFDLGVLDFFCGYKPQGPDATVDTLILSRMLNYTRPEGHSLESWGEYFGIKKSLFNDFSKWSQELEDRCIQDTEINWHLFWLFEKYLSSPRWTEPLRLETLTAILCNTIGTNGMSFDILKAQSLYNTIKKRIDTLSTILKVSFPPKSKIVKSINPRGTAKGTIHLGDFRFLQGEEKDLRPYTIDQPFSLFRYEEFNPASSKQRIERLNAAGWKPFNKTKGHIQALRDRGIPKERLDYFKTYGWTTDEENLGTLPEDAPEGARSLAEWLLLSSRASDLEEWINSAVEE